MGIRVNLFRPPRAKASLIWAERIGGVGGGLREYARLHVWAAGSRSSTWKAPDCLTAPLWGKSVGKVGWASFFFKNHFIRKLSKHLSALLSLPDLFIKIEECPWNQLQISRLIHPSALIWTDTCLPQTYGLWSFILMEQRNHLKSNLN